MYAAFVKLLNMSAAASILIAVVIALRFLLRKTPKKYICILWAVVALRLAFPFSISSAVSAYNYIGNHNQSSGQVEYIHYNEKSEKPMADVTIQAPAESEKNDGPTVVFDSKDIYLPTVMGIWAAGFAAMVLYSVFSYSKVRAQVRQSIPLDRRNYRRDLFICDYIPSPFILGVLKPKIYLPSTLDQEQQDSVIAHERAHIKRLDHLWKPLGFLLLSVHWFNPLVWVAYALLCRDIEMACDEKVIERMTPAQKQAYSAVLLTCSMPRKAITACPLAFGESGVKQRIRGILNYRKPTFWVVAISIVLCFALAVGFLSNPVRTEDYIRFRRAETKPFQPHSYQFSMQMGKTVQGPLVFAEQWQNGELVQSEYCTVPEGETNLAVSVTEIADGAEYQVEIDTNPYTAALKAAFSLPEWARLMDVYSWHGAKDIPLVPDKQVLLAAYIFGRDGFMIFDFDNEDFAEYGDRLRKQECVVLVYAVFPAAQMVPGSTALHYEMNQTAGPASIEYKRLRFDLPEGWFLNLYERTDIRKTSGVFLQEEAVVGGIRSYAMAKDIFYSGTDWIETLDFPEWNTPGLGYYAEGIVGDHCTVEFFSDVPPGIEKNVLNRHYLYYADGRVYDLWFDILRTGDTPRQQILDSVTLEITSGEGLPSALSAYLDPAMVEYRDNSLIDKVSAGKQMTLEELLTSVQWTEQPIPEGVTGPGSIRRGLILRTENGNFMVISYDTDALCIFTPNGNCIGRYTGSYTGEQMVDMLWDWMTDRIHSGNGYMADTTLTQTEPQGMFSILMRPTTALNIDGMGAVTPSNQEEWVAAWNTVLSSDRTTSGRAHAESYYGVTLHYKDTYLQLHKDNDGFSLREMGGSWYCYSVKNAKPLTQLLEPILQEFHYTPVKPSELKDIQYANLVLDGMQYPILPGDPKLSELEHILTSGTPIGYMPACWFTSLLTVGLPSGETKTVSVATDSCGAYLSNGVCYEFPGDNDRLYRLFGVQTQSIAAETSYSGGNRIVTIHHYQLNHEVDTPTIAVFDKENHLVSSTNGIVENHFFHNDMGFCTGYQEYFTESGTLSREFQFLYSQGGAGLAQTVVKSSDGTTMHEFFGSYEQRDLLTVLNDFVKSSPTMQQAEIQDPEHPFIALVSPPALDSIEVLTGYEPSEHSLTLPDYIAVLETKNNGTLTVYVDCHYTIMGFTFHD